MTRTVDATWETDWAANDGRGRHQHSGVITGPWNGNAAGAAAGEREEAGMAIECREADGVVPYEPTEGDGRAPR